MSTTIVNAFKLKRGTSLFFFAQEARAAFRAPIIKAIQQTALENAMFKFDGKPDDYEHVSFSDALSQVISDREDFRDRYCSATESVHVLADESDVVDGEPALYAIFSLKDTHIRSSEVHALALGLSSVEQEYEYWNGTDTQLEVMTAKEWKARKKLWNRLVGFDTIRIQSVSIDLISQFEIFCSDDVSVTRNSILEGARKLELTVFSDEKRISNISFPLYTAKLQAKYPVEEINAAMTVIAVLRYFSTGDVTGLPLYEGNETAAEEALEEAKKRVAAHPFLDS